MRAHIPFHTFRFGNRPLDSSCGTTVLGVSWCGWVGFWSSFWLSKLQQQRWLLAPETSTIARDAVVSWDFSWFYRVQSAFLPETFYNFQYDPRRIFQCVWRILWCSCIARIACCPSHFERGFSRMAWPAPPGVIGQITPTLLCVTWPIRCRSI